MNIKNFDPYDFSKREIDGVPIYYKNLPTAPCINIRIVFNTGAFDEPVGKEGMTHFLEHMLLKGCPSIPNEKSIKEWRRINTLDTLNASTGFNNLTFRLKCLPENYENVLLGLKDMIFHSHLKTEDFEKERKIIIQEAWGILINEKYLKNREEFMKNLFHGHNHSRFAIPLGWPDTIEKISREDAISWYKTNFGVGNFFIVLTGAIEEKHIESIRSFLSDLPKIDKIIKSYGILGKPKQKRFIKTADEIGEIKEQVEMSIIRVSDKISYLENEISSLTQKLLYDLLFERMRTENGICYNIDVGIFLYESYSQVYIGIKTEEKNIELVEKEFNNTISRIIDNRYSDRFNTIKKMYIEQLRSMETLSYNVANNALKEVLKYKKVVTLQERLKDAEKVTNDDVIKFVKWAFDPEYIFTEIILPSKK